MAEAGPDQTVPRNTLVTLDGSGSNDPDTDPFTFDWSITNQPAGSTATLTNPTSVNPTFTPDINGTYTIELIVNDGTENSDPDTVVITAVNTQPVANAGPDQTVSKGVTVQLDGSASSDANSDPLTFAWSLTQQPASSTSILSDPSLVNPTFVADREGTYVAQLIVDDGTVQSAPDTVTITVVNDPPVLDPVGNQTVNLGQRLTFNLTGTDPNGDPLTFSATPLPLPANMTLNASNGEVTFKPDATQAGDHVFTMIVSDGVLTDSETVTITVQAEQPGGVTELSGRLLDTHDFVYDTPTPAGTETPVVGATVSLLNTGVSTTTDAQGFFTLTGVPGGVQVFDINTSTAGLAPDGSTYAAFRENISLIEQVTNDVDRPFYLPRIDAASVTTVDPATTTTVENTTLDVMLEVAPNTAKNEDGSIYEGPLSISEVPAILAPAPMPDELQPGLLITIQPVGVRFSPPAPITFPNLDNLPPGSETDIWGLDPVLGRFVVTGKAQVSADGTKIETTKGGVFAADWHFVAPQFPELPSSLDENNLTTPTGGGPGGLGSNGGAQSCTITSQIEMCSGSLEIEHQLSAYVSQGQARSPRLVYRSVTADPQPIMFYHPTLPGTVGLPTTLSLRMALAGIDQGQEVFFSTGTLTNGQSQTIRQAMQFDASTVATGVYPYTMTMTNHYPQSAISVNLRNEVVVNNQIGSSVGAGWMIDGISKLYKQPETGSVLLTEGNGATVFFEKGIYSEKHMFSVRSMHLQKPNLLKGDLNSDQIPDFVVVHDDPAEASVFLGTGNGEFTPGQQGIDVGGFGTATGTDQKLADFNEDGNPDLLVGVVQGDPVDEGVNLFLGDGAGGFAPPLFIQTSPDNDLGPSALATGDFNGDGHVDFVSANVEGLNQLEIFLGGGTGGFAPPLNIPAVGAGAPVNRMLAEDFTGDGILDLVTENRNSTQPVMLFTGDGTGNFSDPVFYGDGSSVGFASWFTNLKAGDLNNDGDLDLVLPIRRQPLDQDEILVFLNDRLGGFLPPITRSAEGQIFWLTLEDMNDDGNLDLITADPLGPVSVVDGDGVGGFNPRKSLPRVSANTTIPILVEVDDLDQDGDADLVVFDVQQPNFGTSVLRIFHNGGESQDFVTPKGDFSRLEEHTDGTFTRFLKNGTRIHFNAQGLQTSVVDRNGNATTYDYDGSDRIETVMDPVGLVTTYHYAGAYLARITDPANRDTLFEHDPEGNLTKITDPDGSEREFTYDARHRMTSKTSKRDHVSLYEYNAAGRLMKSTGPDGFTREFTSGEVAGLVDPASGAGTEGNPATITLPDAVQHTFTDGRNKVTTFTTDSFGRTNSRLDPLGRQTTIDRNRHGDPEIITDPNGAVTEFTYDDQGNVLTQEDAAGQPIKRTTTFEYDPNFNQVIKVIDPQDHETIFVIDPANGNIDKIINPKTDERVFTYVTDGPLAGSGLVETVEDERGELTTFTYDAQGNVETILDSEGHTTRFTRDPAGNVLTMTEGEGTPEARTRTFTYDTLNRLTSATDGTANPPTLFRYDDHGNIQEIELPTGEIEIRTYDEINRVKTVNNPTQGLTQFEYDGNGNLIEAKNALNDATTFIYDDVNQLLTITDALTGEQQLTYDLSGNVETFTDTNGHTTTFGYDVLNRQIARTNPLGHETSFLYDKRDNLTRITDPKGQVITGEYDELSRLTRLNLLTAPDPEVSISSISYSRDAVGNVSSVSGGFTQVSLSYDGLNRVITERIGINAVQPPVTLTHTYDAVGNRIQLDESESFANPPLTLGTTTYEYDGAGRLTKLTMPASQEITLGYDPAGRLASQVFPNGVVTAYDYDAQGRLNGLSHTSGINPSFADFGYTYNPVGNILSIIDDMAAPQTRNFTYDALQRLRTGGATSTPETYDYDPAGNRLTSFLSTLHQHNSANHLEEDDDFTYTYDLNGNLESKTDKATSEVTTYSWDVLNRLTQIDFPDGTTTTYQYDGLGRRTVKDVNGTITRYVYDGDDLVLEYDENDTFVARYSHGDQIDQPLAVQRAGVGFFYYHADHQGSITHLTDSSGNIANTYTYDGYGRVLTLSESVIQPFTYTGREFDGESGLYYYRARYYDPNTGRFLSEDPIGFDAGDQNLYRYVANNPVNVTDPSGENPAAVVGFVIGLGGGVAGTLAQGGSLGEALINGLIGGTLGAAAGFGLPVLGTPLGAGTTGALGNLFGQALTKEPCKDFNFSSAIGSGLGSSLGPVAGSVISRLPGFANAGTLGQAVATQLPGLGLSGGGGLLGTGIGILTGF